MYIRTIAAVLLPPEQPFKKVDAKANCSDYCILFLQPNGIKKFNFLLVVPAMAAISIMLPLLSSSLACARLI